jgi:hypothetical protein
MGQIYEDRDGVVQATPGGHWCVRNRSCTGTNPVAGGSAARACGSNRRSTAFRPIATGTAAAVGCADRALSGCTGCADSCSFYLSNTDCRSGEISPAESKSDRCGARCRSGQAGLGSERKGLDSVSICACRHGQEPFVDLGTGRYELQPAGGYHDRHTIHAGQSRRCGPFKHNATTKRDQPWGHSQHSTGESGCRVCARL